jgi:hypothetical protein
VVSTRAASQPMSMPASDDRAVRNACCSSSTLDARSGASRSRSLESVSAAVSGENGCSPSVTSLRIPWRGDSIGRTALSPGSASMRS